MKVMYTVMKNQANFRFIDTITKGLMTNDIYFNDDK